ncbi:MAG: MlaD family protein [Planctomycetota bacterium]
MTAPGGRWKLGLFVVAGAGVLLFGLMWLGMARLQRPVHIAFAFFDEPLVGLEPGSPVKFRGVSIGVVDTIRLAVDKKHLQVRAALYDDRLADLGFDTAALGPECEFPADLRAQLVTSYLTQTSFVLVDFYRGDGADRELPFTPPKNTIRTVRSTFRSVEEGLRDVLRELPELVESARQLIDETRSDLRAANVPELSARAERALEVAEARVRDIEQLSVVQSAEAAFREITDLARGWGDDQGPVRALQREVEAVGQDLRAALAAADLGGTSRSLQAAGDGAAALSLDLQQQLPRLRSTLAAIERLAELLERDPGALLRGRGDSGSPLRDR